MTAAALTLSVLVGQLSVLGDGPIVPIVVVYAAVGFLIARRRPRNPIGWILIAFIVVFLLSEIVGSYAVLSYRLGHRGLPLAPVAVVLPPSWAPALLLFPVVILLFPDGGLASRRWRWVLGPTRRAACWRPSSPLPSRLSPIKTSTWTHSGT
jgi:hypothetical protein